MTLTYESRSLRPFEPPNLKPPNLRALRISTLQYMGGMYVNLSTLMRTDTLPRIDAFLHTCSIRNNMPTSLQASHLPTSHILGYEMNRLLC